MNGTRRWLVPGEWYRVGCRPYQLPALKVHGRAFVQDEALLVAMRELLRRSTACLAAVHVRHWLSGGTLLGFVRHGTFLPWDDDIDLHVGWSSQEYLFSSSFACVAAKYGLEVIFLPDASIWSASRIGAAVRLRNVGSRPSGPVCEIYFVQEQTESRWSKIDSWCYGHLESSVRETWKSEQLFPLQTVELDGLRLAIPAQPEAVLQQQYGSKVMSEMHVDLASSHSLLFSDQPWVVRSSSPRSSV